MIKSLKNNNITPEELDAYLTKMENVINKASAMADRNLIYFVLHQKEIENLMANYKIMMDALNRGYLLPNWEEL